MVDGVSLEPRVDPMVFANQCIRVKRVNEGLASAKSISENIEFKAGSCGGEWYTKTSLRLCKIWEALTREAYKGRAKWLFDRQVFAGK
jgi:hypothetical protein